MASKLPLKGEAMVATVTALGAAQSTVHYFERDGYYAKNDPEHRRASFWHGRGAAALRLRGYVRPKRFEEVLAGYVPHTDIRLGRKRDGEHQHRPGLDLTLCAPKSASLEGLVFGERRVVRAHDAAVRETLDWVEAELLQTRGYIRATGERPRVRADGMVAAGFRHLTSRNQDPRLHTHCVVANMTRNAQGAWRSLETTKVRRSEKLIGAYYRNALAQRLQALGYAIAPTLVGRIPGFEIAGYDWALLDAFSGRRREILARVKAHGLPYTPETAQMAALHTTNVGHHRHPRVALLVVDEQVGGDVHAGAFAVAQQQRAERVVDGVELGVVLRHRLAVRLRVLDRGGRQVACAHWRASRTGGPVRDGWVFRTNLPRG